MKFTHLFLVFAVAVLTSLGAVHLVSKENTQHETAVERVLRTGTLRCGYAISPPILMKDVNTGQLSGLDYDVWNRIGLELGLKIEWTEEVGWGVYAEGLKAGRYDAFCGQAWPNPERAKFTALTRPVLYAFLNAYVRPGDTRFDGGIDSINKPDVIIPAVDGDISAHMVRTGFPQAKMLSLPQMATVSDLIVSLTTGKADVIFMESAMFDDFMKTNPGAMQRVPYTKPVFTFSSHYSFAPDDVRLRDMVNIALGKMLDDGSLKAMAAGYSADYTVAAPGYAAH